MNARRRARDAGSAAPPTQLHTRRPRSDAPAKRPTAFHSNSKQPEAAELAGRRRICQPRQLARTAPPSLQPPQRTSASRRTQVPGQYWALDINPGATPQQHGPTSHLTRCLGQKHPRAGDKTGGITCRSRMTSWS
eukprot:353916-Chlamydomonas_euryale.AAC.4